MSIDASKFSVNERTNEYEVTFAVRGRVTLPIEAASIEDARAKAKAMLDEDEDDHLVELDEIDDVRTEYVRKTPPMYRVTRNGKPMQVSRLDDGDTPREPDERGF